MGQFNGLIWFPKRSSNFKIESAENPFHPKYLVKLYKSDQYDYQLISTTKSEAADFKPLDKRRAALKLNYILIPLQIKLQKFNGSKKMDQIQPLKSRVIQ